MTSNRLLDGTGNCYHCGEPNQRRWYQLCLVAACVNHIDAVAQQLEMTERLAEIRAIRKSVLGW